MKKMLLLGHTGKMGTALKDLLGREYDIVGKNSSDFSAQDLGVVREFVDHVKPGIVVNTVAFSGIDACEQDPVQAVRVNTLFPKYLAELSLERGFKLVHFSTDAVFADRGEGFYTEDDTARPVNMYGLTKYGGDCFVGSIARDFYILRISVLFGQSLRHTQFVEKMLKKVYAGAQSLRIADDIVASPTYSYDVAAELSRMLRESVSPGLYHVVNDGRASLWELMSEISGELGLDVGIERGSYRDFPAAGRKNTCTPLRSKKLPALRPWRDAVKDYAGSLKCRE